MPAIVLRLDRGIGRGAWDGSVTVPVTLTSSWPQPRVAAGGFVANREVPGSTEGDQLEGAAVAAGRTTLQVAASHSIPGWNPMHSSYPYYRHHFRSLVISVPDGEADAEKLQEVCFCEHF
jgi:hypothetical protein